MMPYVIAGLLTFAMIALAKSYYHQGQYEGLRMGMRIGLDLAQGFCLDMAKVTKDPELKRIYQEGADFYADQVKKLGLERVEIPAAGKRPADC